MVPLGYYLIECISFGSQYTLYGNECPLNISSEVEATMITRIIHMIVAKVLTYNCTFVLNSLFSNHYLHVW